MPYVPRALCAVTPHVPRTLRALVPYVPRDARVSSLINSCVSRASCFMWPRALCFMKPFSLRTLLFRTLRTLCRNTTFLLLRFHATRFYFLEVGVRWGGGGIY